MSTRGDLGGGHRGGGQGAEPPEAEVGFKKFTKNNQWKITFRQKFSNFDNFNENLVIFQIFLNIFSNFWPKLDQNLEKLRRNHLYGAFNENLRRKINGNLQFVRKFSQIMIGLLIFRSQSK